MSLLGTFLPVRFAHIKIYGVSVWVLVMPSKLVTKIRWLLLHFLGAIILRRRRLLFLL